MDDICKSCGKRIYRTQEMMTCRDGYRHHPVCLTGKAGYALTEDECAQYGRPRGPESDKWDGGE
jgi:hypothetical protein